LTIHYYNKIHKATTLSKEVWVI